MTYIKIACALFLTVSAIAGSLVAADSYDTAKIEAAKQELVGTFDGYRLEQAQMRIDDLTEQLEYEQLNEGRRALKERELIYREREVEKILRGME